MIINNFKSIIVSIFIIIAHGIFGISTGKLTAQENEHRLVTCGKEGRSISPNNSKPPSWFWVSYTTLPDNKTMFTSASQISSRHFLTFSTNLLTADKKWRHSGEAFDVNCTDKKNLFIEVPTEIVKQLKFKLLDCYRNPNCTKPALSPIKAYLPEFCDKHFDKWFRLSYSPMVVEVQETIPGNPLCFTSKNDQIVTGKTVESHLLYQNMKTRRSNLNVTSLDSIIIATSPVKGTFSGALISNIDEQLTVVGYAGSSFVYTDSGQQCFFRMSWFSKAICEMTGICGEAPAKPMPTVSRATSTRSPLSTRIEPTTGRSTAASTKPTLLLTRRTKPTTEPLTSTAEVTIRSLTTVIPTTTEPSTVIPFTTTVSPTVIPTTSATEMPTSTVPTTRLPTTPELTTMTPLATTELGTTLDTQMTSDPITLTPLASTELGTTLGAPTPFIFEAPTTPRSLGMIEFTVGPSPLERTEFEDDYEEYEEFRKHDELREEDDDEEHEFFEDEEKKNVKKRTGIELVLVLVMIFIMKFDF